MSNTDSFIDEVTEEVRKDQLIGALRKYGWIGALIIVGVVGGAVFSEIYKNRKAAAAAAAGDALSGALEAETPSERAAALGAVADTYGETVMLAELARANELAELGQVDDARTAIEAAKAAAPQDASFQDMIVLKALLMPALRPEPAEVISQLEELTTAGRPYRLLALEQIGYAQIAADRVSDALGTFETIVEDAAVPVGLRGRAEQMIVALGGDTDEL